MLEIPNDQFQLEPIYKPIPVGIWVNWLESRREHVGKKNKHEEKSENYKPLQVSSSIYLLGAQFPFQVGVKGFILTISFQNGFFRQTKCKLSRVPNIPNYCSTYKTLSSSKLFLDLAWMLQPNGSWVQAVLTVLLGPAGRSCDRRREVGTGKGTNSILCVLGGREQSLFFPTLLPEYS